MDASHIRGESVARRTAIWNLIAPTIFPLAVVVSATPITLMIHADATPVLLGWCVVLLGLAAWLNRVLFHRVKTFLPFLVAIVVVLSIWFWQKQAFALLVPHEGLTYGYFLTPSGAHARFWVLACPFWVGTTCLLICSIVAVVLGWRTGARHSLACMIPWWIAALVIFALPSMYLDAQGNASVFI
jgi:hypothetical protein